MLKHLLANYCRRVYFGDEKTPIPPGVYHPSILCLSCARAQYNYYTNFSNKSVEEIPDEIVLLLAGGVFVHRLIQSLKVDKKSIWSGVEVPCSYELTAPDGSTITIRGRADAILGRGVERRVYEFKHVRSIPYKPQFNHLLQLNFYLGALGIAQGVLCYIGYSPYGGIDIKEFNFSFSTWHFEHLLNRAITLHTLITNKTPPRCSCRDKIHEIQIL